MQLAKRIEEGCEYPRWYGFAYRDWMHNQAVCYPVGLNWLAGLLHGGYIRLAHGPFHTCDRFDFQLLEANVDGYRRGMAHAEERIQGRIQRAYDDGVRIGKQTGYSAGWRGACDQVEQQIAQPRVAS